jgi:hypothetical protein
VTRRALGWNPVVLLAAWAAGALALVMAPTSVLARLLVAVPFSLIGVGLAALLVIPVRGAAAFSLALLIGLASLILPSQLLTYMGWWVPHGPSITLALQVLVTYGLIGLSLLRPRRDDAVKP